MTHVLRFSFAVALIGWGGAARADVAPPETSPCVGKQVGDSCTYNGAGVCQSSTCSKLDYLNWDRDASSSPPTTTYACVKCLPGPSTGTVTATNTGTQSATDTATASPKDTATVSATNTGTNTQTDDKSTGDDGWCAIGGKLTAKRVAPWLLAGAFSLLFLFGRRRRG